MLICGWLGTELSVQCSFSDLTLTAGGSGDPI